MGAQVENGYLVRGALVRCDKGSHPRRINLPESYGLYMLENPLIKPGDCKYPVNISYFGVCQAEKPPEGAEVVYLAGYCADNGESLPDSYGPKCCPTIVGTWRKTLKDGVTMESYLVCACGGLIQPVTSGQEYKE